VPNERIEPRNSQTVAAILIAVVGTIGGAAALLWAAMSAGDPTGRVVAGISGSTFLAGGLVFGVALIRRRSDGRMLNS